MKDIIYNAVKINYFLYLSWSYLWVVNVEQSITMLFSHLPFPLPPNQIWKFYFLWYCLSWVLWAPLYLVIQPCLTPCDLMVSGPPGFTVGLLLSSSSPGKNTGVGCHALLQGILPTQGLDPGLPYCRHFHFCLSHHRSTLILFVSSK